MTSIGAVLALEVEQEMYTKYVLPTGSVKKEYNKKDYRQHYLMLMRNLKQRHNDPLVITLFVSTLCGRMQVLSLNSSIHRLSHFLFCNCYRVTPFISPLSLLAFYTSHTSSSVFSPFPPLSHSPSHSLTLLL